MEPTTRNPRHGTLCRWSGLSVITSERLSVLIKHWIGYGAHPGQP